MEQNRRYSSIPCNPLCNRNVICYLLVGRHRLLVYACANLSPSVVAIPINPTQCIAISLLETLCSMYMLMQFGELSVPFVL